MDKNKILGMVDHTLLKQDATWEQIREILDDGMTYHTASACIPASYVKQAAEYVQGQASDLHGHRISERLQYDGSEGVRGS